MELNGFFSFKKKLKSPLSEEEKVKNWSMVNYLSVHSISCPKTSRGEAKENRVDFCGHRSDPMIEICFIIHMD